MGWEERGGPPGSAHVHSPAFMISWDYSCSDGKALPEVAPNTLPKRVCWLLADKGICEIAASI